MMRIFNKKDKRAIFTVAFYNVENLFDTYNNPKTFDDDFLPKSDRHWTAKRYKKKLKKLGYTISKIGKKKALKPPSLIGLAEVENKTVLRDLLNSKHLKEYSYSFVHYDSPDERGIDVALLYDATIFTVLRSKNYKVDLKDKFRNKDFTRDILWVYGVLNDEKIHIIINHWSSRREGTDETEYKRIISANRVSDIVEDIKQVEDDPKIIIMGDFNDDPSSKSIKKMLHENNLFNPMETLLSYTRGSLNHDFNWNLFDQILFTTNFFSNDLGTLGFYNANIFDEEFLKQFRGKYKGNPFRTYVGKKYKGGYSDHFPVYIHLKEN